MDVEGFRMWWRWLRLKWQARHATVEQAAEAMFLLNRYAQGQYRDAQIAAIYSLKTALIVHLWSSDFSYGRVSKERQEMQCWRCMGSGRDPYWWIYTEDDQGNPETAECVKCGGGGIYRTHVLYKFTFQIGGKTYIWHQPRNVMGDYPLMVAVAEAATEPDELCAKYTQDTSDNSDRRTLDRAEVERLVAMVYQYLWRVGFRQAFKTPWTFRAAARRAWRTSRTRYYLRELRWRINRTLDDIWNDAGDDEFPF